MVFLWLSAARTNCDIFLYSSIPVSTKRPITSTTSTKQLFEMVTTICPVLRDSTVKCSICLGYFVFIFNNNACWTWKTFVARTFSVQKLHISEWNLFRIEMFSFCRLCAIQAGWTLFGYAHIFVFVIAVHSGVSQRLTVAQWK